MMSVLMNPERESALSHHHTRHTRTHSEETQYSTDDGTAGSVCDGRDAVRLQLHRCCAIQSTHQSGFVPLGGTQRLTILLDTVIVTTARTTQRANVGGAEHPVISNCTCAWDIPS